MKHKIIALLAVCCLSCKLSAEQVSISTKITVDGADKEAVLAELQQDSKDLTEKYAGARGVTEVETNVEETSEDAVEDCGCTQKEEVAQDEATAETKCAACSGEKPENKCGCNKPKPRSGDEDDVVSEEASEETDEVKCGCNKPKPRSITRSQEVAACEDCAGHVQVNDKIERNEAGDSVCSDCKDTLRKCSSCSKEKCCKKCSKCCSSCSSSSSCCK